MSNQYSLATKAVQFIIAYQIKSLDKTSLIKSHHEYNEVIVSPCPHGFELRTTLALDVPDALAKDIKGLECKDPKLLRIAVLKTNSTKKANADSV